MGTLDLDDEHLKERTIEDFITAVIDLDPQLKLIDALLDAQRDIEFWKNRYVSQEHLLKQIIKERDEALARLTLKS